jgi:hypothetical protein
VFAAGVLLFLYNVVRSRTRGAPAGENPWGAPTLEWSTPSPPPPYNFAVIPSVASRHPLWEDALEGEDRAHDAARSVTDRGPLLADGRQTLGTTSLDAVPAVIYDMPGDSYWPLLLTLGLTALFYGLLVWGRGLAVVGALWTIGCMVGWLWPGPARKEA